MSNLVFNYMSRKDQLLELSPTKKQAVIKLAAKIFDKILKTPGADVEESYIFTLSALWIRRKTSVFKDRAEKLQSVFRCFVSFQT